MDLGQDERHLCTNAGLTTLYKRFDDENSNTNSVGHLIFKVGG